VDYCVELVKRVFATGPVFAVMTDDGGTPKSESGGRLGHSLPWETVRTPQISTKAGQLLPEERRSRILRALDRAGTLSTEQLATELRVSAETIRRDLIRLDRHHQLRRVHGGAMAATAIRREEAPFAHRAESDAEAKRRIGELAASLTSADQTLIVDIGTTALAGARALPETFRGTVLTCSLVAAAELAGRPGVEVLVAAGRVRGGDLAVSNALTVAFFNGVRADVAFLGTGGVSAEQGITDYYIDEIATRRVIIANSNTTYALADTSKLGSVAPHHVCGLEEVTAVITDREPTPEMEAAIRQAGGRTIYPA
jgi:DeoR family transcriptional regulator, fructose operon transcriptional repressor